MSRRESSRAVWIGIGSVAFLFACGLAGALAEAGGWYQ